MIAVKQHCGDTVRLSFADPTQKLKNAVITVKGKILSRKNRRNIASMPGKGKYGHKC